MPIHQTVLILPTETYAERAESVLAGARIRSEIQRTAKPQGCSFRLTASAPPERVRRLLTTAKIPFQSG